MRWSITLILMLFAFMLGVAAQQKLVNNIAHRKYCDALKKSQYQKRQDYLSFRSKQCDNTSGPSCIYEVLRTGEYLNRFDGEVLKFEECL